MVVQVVQMVCRGTTGDRPGTDHVDLEKAEEGSSAFLFEDSDIKTHFSRILISNENYFEENYGIYYWQQKSFLRNGVN